jgi:putative addiction module component (TIGR02574 family)
MARSLQDIERDIRALEPAQRHQLLRDLVTELDDGNGAESVESMWRSEARRRLDELRSGAAEPVAAEEVFAKARSRLGDAG